MRIGTQEGGDNQAKLTIGPQFAMGNCDMLFNIPPKLKETRMRIASFTYFSSNKASLALTKRDFSVYSAFRVPLMYSSFQVQLLLCQFALQSFKHIPIIWSSVGESNMRFQIVI